MPDHSCLIFINYRGSVQNWATELVYARMTEAFGADAVFKAGNSIRAGERFPSILRRQAAACPVMLSCVGPGWLTAQGPGDGAWTPRTTGCDRRSPSRWRPGTG